VSDHRLNLANYMSADTGESGQGFATRPRR
jgi:hypothetical protein